MASPPTPPDVTLWYREGCRACGDARQLLEGMRCAVTPYAPLAEPPTVERVRSLLRELGKSPRQVVETAEPAYAALLSSRGGPAHVDDEVLVASMAADPTLLPHPIVVVGGVAVVARPPQVALRLLVPSPADGRSARDTMLDMIRGGS